MTTTPTSVSETIEIPGASPAEVFAFLTDPANHVPASGGTPEVLGPVGPDRLTAKGDRFGMRMRWIVPYRVTNTVVEFEQDERLAWRHFGGHRWRYELQPLADDAGTRVTETFDMSPVPSIAHPVYRSVFGFPRAYEKNLRRSLEQLRGHLAG